MDYNPWRHKDSDMTWQRSSNNWDTLAISLVIERATEWLTLMGGMLWTKRWLTSPELCEISSHCSELPAIKNLLLISRIFHLIFLDLSWLQVAETLESKATDEGTAVYFSPSLFITLYSNSSPVTLLLTLLRLLTPSTTVSEAPSHCKQALCTLDKTSLSLEDPCLTLESSLFFFKSLF